jgi:hypothetical protein
MLAIHWLNPSQVDTYGLHAASAVAALSAFRSIAGFAFPLFSSKPPTLNTLP